MQNALCVANLNHRPTLASRVLGLVATVDITFGTRSAPTTGRHRHQDGGAGAQREEAQRSWARQSADLGQCGWGVAPRGKGTSTRQCAGHRCSNCLHLLAAAGLGGSSDTCWRGALFMDTGSRDNCTETLQLYRFTEPSGLGLIPVKCDSDPGRVPQLQQPRSSRHPFAAGQAPRGPTMPAQPGPPPPWAPHPAGSLRSSPGASLPFPEDSRQDSTSSTWFQGLQGSLSDLFSAQVSPQCRPSVTSLFKTATHLPAQPTPLLRLTLSTAPITIQNTAWISRVYRL